MFLESSTTPIPRGGHRCPSQFLRLPTYAHAVKRIGLTTKFRVLIKVDEENVCRVDRLQLWPNTLVTNANVRSVCVLMNTLNAPRLLSPQNE